MPIQQAPLTQHVYPALLNASGTCTLDTNGDGIAYCGPSGVGNAWSPAQVAVFTSTNNSTPTATLYLGPNIPTQALATLMGTSQVTQLAGTATGDNDSIGLLNVNVQPGQALIVQWLGGDPTATATLVVTGSQIATYWR